MTTEKTVRTTLFRIQNAFFTPFALLITIDWFIDVLKQKPRHLHAEKAV